MSGRASPLRFLGLVFGGWICGRLVFVAPALLMEAAVAEEEEVPLLAKAAPTIVVSQPVRLATVARYPAPPTSGTAVAVGPVPPSSGSIRPVPQLAVRSAASPPEIPTSQPLSPVPLPGLASLPASQPERGLPLPIGPSDPTLNRWSISAWAFVRRGSGQQLATAGALGGSQVGARATYGLTGRIAISARLYSPLSRTGGAEASLGMELQPLRAVPVRILAERRQALGREGRSAFALLAHGGVSEQPLLGSLRLDGYAQAGVVGLKARDAFADGAIRIGVPVTDNLSLGLGAWGAAQPGASRVDLGPQASYRLPVLDRRARLSAEWRVRVAGDARPGSGPALTLSTDF